MSSWLQAIRKQINILCISEVQTQTKLTPHVSGSHVQPYEELTTFLKNLCHKYGISKQKIKNIVHQGSFEPKSHNEKTPEKRNYKSEYSFKGEAGDSCVETAERVVYLDDQRASEENDFGFIKYFTVSEDSHDGIINIQGIRGKTSVDDNDDIIYCPDTAECPYHKPLLHNCTSTAQPFFFHKPPFKPSFSADTQVVQSKSDDAPHTLPKRNILQPPPIKPRNFRSTINIPKLSYPVSVVENLSQKNTESDLLQCRNKLKDLAEGQNNSEVRRSNTLSGMMLVLSEEDLREKPSDECAEKSKLNLNKNMNSSQCSLYISDDRISNQDFPNFVTDANICKSLPHYETAVKKALTEKNEASYDEICNPYYISDKESIQSCDSGLADVSFGYMSPPSPTSPIYQTRSHDIYADWLRSNKPMMHGFPLASTTSSSNIPCSSTDISVSSMSSSCFDMISSLSSRTALSDDVIVSPLSSQVSIAPSNLGDDYYQSGLYAHWWKKVRVPRSVPCYQYIVIGGKRPALKKTENQHQHTGNYSVLCLPNFTRLIPVKKLTLMYIVQIRELEYLLSKKA